MKKLLLIAVLAGLSFSTQARKVVFQVDMTGQTISANGVHLAGNLKDPNNDQIDENPNQFQWDPSQNQLTDPNADGIYTIMLDLAGNFMYDFKFVNNNSWASGVESVPAISQISGGGGNDNRFVYLPNGTDTITLAPIRFGMSSPAGMKTIRFTVDMKNETVGANGVHVAGDFQGWSPSKTAMFNYAGNGSYSGTRYFHLGYVPVGATGGATQFKYVNGNDWPQSESVPSSCNVGGNRTFGESAGDTVLPAVCYASCDACPTAPIPVYNVTFRVDMTTACGQDSVDVAGGAINGWAGGTWMTPISSGSKIYSVTVPLDSGEIEYKFRKHLNGFVVWEGVANRKQVLSSDTTLNLVCFNQDSLCAAPVAPADVHFIVDLSNEIPNPNGDIFVMGNFTLPNWQDGAIRLTPVSGQIGWYETTFNMCEPAFAFVFSNGPVGSNSNVEQFPNTADRACVVSNGVGGFNRVFTRTDGTAKTLAFTFNSCNSLNVGIDNNKLEASAISMFPNPSNGSTSISFNDNAAKHNVTVTDVTGRVVAKYSTLENNLNVNTSNLNAGVYFVTIQNDRNENASLKLMVR